MYGQTLIEHSGVTRVSLRTWKMTRPLYGEFTEALCSRTWAFRRYDLAVQRTVDGEYLPKSATDGPGLVLIDESGSELWLSGCMSGYGGEGVAGTGYILRAEGFSPAHIDLVPDAKLLHLRKGQAEPLVHRAADEEVTRDRSWSRHIEDLLASGYFKDIEAI